MDSLGIWLFATIVILPGVLLFMFGNSASSVPVLDRSALGSNTSPYNHPNNKPRT